MKYEEIQVRIAKNGEVFIRVNSSDEQRLRDYRAFLEEVLGPIREETRFSKPDWEKTIEHSGEDQKSREIGLESGES